MARRSTAVVLPAVVLAALPAFPVLPAVPGGLGAQEAAALAVDTGGRAGEGYDVGLYGQGSGHSRWRGAWAASPQAPTSVFSKNWSEAGFTRQTVRQVVRVSTGGTRARIELSNRYGRTPLKVAGATIARTERGASVKAGSVRPLTFGHARSATIPAGGELRSDAVGFTVRPLESLTVTLYLDEPTGPATFHLRAVATSYRAAGDHRSDVGAAAFTETSQSWYYLSGVEVSGGRAAHRDGVVAFGDSITDGSGSTVDADNRYPDELAERFAAAGRPRSIVNQGISGNQLTNSMDWAGEKAVARFREDVLNEPNVGTVILLEGINDIGMSEWDEMPGGYSPDRDVAELIAAQRELVRQAHARGVKVIGATLTPFKGAMYYTERGEIKRDALNDWIRNSGEFDGVLDLDRALADPADPDRMAAAYDIGDHLHPNDAGYRAMADVVDLNRL
ncbi:SGNH/GDSL hydrolase family protein [Streptomyces halobius]|uniref:SGNH/GDSL hydrolase family protein n=1 Tax=Streptomyces halobius TaxID=2879846 RepID=A0ABY4M7H4_9ACTN|nr:SGNH/GDSL hydrolase family protein [Streptomyces halobius]UQA93638.1 SGNH/GDSL hydrolase family protein [Streptomyces halobius]